MRLHQKNLWAVASHEGSSLDQFDAVGGLTAGAICLPSEFYAKAKGIRVWTTTKPDAPESYYPINAFTAAIGGKHVKTGNGPYTVVEFDTSKSSDGTRGIYKIDGAFEYEHLWSEPLTKGEAARLIVPTKLDLYDWDGARTITEDQELNMCGLIYSTTIAEGHTTMENGNMRVLPQSARPRALFLSVDITGEFKTDGPHPFRLEVRQADGVEVERIRPAYFLRNKLNKVTFEFMFYTHGLEDAFSTTGFRLYLVNESTASLSLTGVRIIANAIINPDFSM